MPASRFAPSPTGPLHLGHAYSALMAHDAAREAGGAFRLRIDDLDGGRVREQWRAAIDTDLAWLGLTPDGAPWVQSERLPAYAAALDRLRAMGLAYPCFCTRADIAAAVAASVAAPHGPDSAPYPGLCRALDPAEARARIAAGEAAAWRLDMTAAIRLTGPLAWHDAVAGTVQADPAPAGDIVLARRDAVVAYHLCSTLDDAAMAIDRVVRGADLFGATHIHRLLQALLGLPTPAYHHHRLVGDASARRLAKRSDAASLATLRGGGTDPVVLVAALRDGQLPLGFCWVDP